MSVNSIFECWRLIESLKSVWLNDLNKESSSRFQASFEKDNDGTFLSVLYGVLSSLRTDIFKKVK
jgi:hypothetical protein